MSTKNIVIISVVVIGGFLAWQYWQKKQREKVAATSPVAPSTGGSIGGIVDTVTEAWNDLSNLWGN